MKIGVIGAGAIGGTIAALLARAGHSVQVTARGEQLAAIRARGLTLGGAFGDFVADVGAEPALTIAPDLVFVTTKAQDADAAIRANVDLLRDIPVIVVQNGLESIETAARAAPHSAIVGGLALYAASYLSPGQVTVTTDGSTYLGGEPDATRVATAVLGAVMPVDASTNFAGAQWTKLIVNHVNALPAITGMSVQEVISHRGLRTVMIESMQEAVRVGHASGVVFESMQGLTDASLTAFERAPVLLAQALPLAMRSRMGARANPGSTLQSIRRGQLTEIDFLNGAIVRLGTTTRVATPVSGELVAMVHEVEASGAFIAPAAVVARVRAVRTRSLR